MTNRKSDHDVLRSKVIFGAGGGEWCPRPEVDSAEGGE